MNLFSCDRRRISTSIAFPDCDLPPSSTSRSGHFDRSVATRVPSIDKNEIAHSGGPGSRERPHRLITPLDTRPWHSIARKVNARETSKIEKPSCGMHASTRDINRYLRTREGACVYARVCECIVRVCVCVYMCAYVCLYTFLLIRGCVMYTPRSVHRAHVHPHFRRRDLRGLQMHKHHWARAEMSKGPRITPFRKRRPAPLPGTREFTFGYSVSSVDALMGRVKSRGTVNAPNLHVVGNASTNRADFLFMGTLEFYWGLKGVDNWLWKKMSNTKHRSSKQLLDKCIYVWVSN